MSEPLNFEEALELAQYKQENSNMARCYIVLAADNERLLARLAATETLLQKAEQNELLMVEKIDSAETRLVEALAYWFSDANPAETPFAPEFDAFQERQP